MVYLLYVSIKRNSLNKGKWAASELRIWIAVSFNWRKDDF
jgi:hypothetical protein